jgi:uncharacterized protein (DUF885 family)
VYVAPVNARFAAALALAACAHGAPAPSTSNDFARFVDDYWDAVFAFAPSRATSIGLHQYDGKLDDFSQVRIEQRVAELKRLLSRLGALDPARFSFDDAIDAEALGNLIHGELLELEVVRSWERNPMDYAVVPGGAIHDLMKRDFAPGRVRLRSVIARMEQIPRIYAAARENMRNPPKEFTDLALRFARGSVGFFEGSVAQWARGAAGGDTGLLGRFEQANAATAQATRSFAEWLEKELLPRSHGNYALGDSTFVALLRYSEMIQLPLPQLLQRGEAQLAKDRAAFIETARRIDPTRRAPEVYASLANDHPRADDLISTVARSVEDARKFVVEKDLVTVPSEVPVRVEETPPFARIGAGASMDTPGAYETKATEAFYYVTPVEKDWDAQHQEEHLRAYSTYLMAMTNVHEAYPGHYLQFLYARRFPTKTRKLTFTGSNVEGWAHYAEEMMVDEGFGNGDPRMRLAQLEEALLRDCRYVVGIKLHTEGWTVEQGRSLFVDQCFQEPANAYEESRRGAYNPTYLYYTFGKLEIQRMASEYMRQKHASLKQFHDAFVSQGGLPLPLVQRILFR